MAVGDLAEVAARSYVAVGRETTFGTYLSATTAIEAVSCTFRTDIESRVLEEIGRNLSPARRIQLGKNVGGTLEHFLHPQESVLLIANALGGGIASSITAVTGVSLHSITSGNFDTIAASLSFNVRKGSTLTWRYLGGRVNNFRITGAVGEPIRASYDLVFMDSTQLSDDIQAILSISTVLPFTFMQGVYRYSSTEALAATTTAVEPIQSFDLSVSNNLATGPEARRFGTNTVQVLPATSRRITLSVTQRFDTTTSYNRFIQATQGAIEFFFQGATITASAALAPQYEMVVRLPKVFYNSADPMLDTPNDVLQHDFTVDVVNDNPYTTTGKDVGITFRNEVATY